MRLPFVDVETVNGFIVMTLYEGILLNYEVLVCYAVDMLFILYCFVGAAYLNLCRIDCEQLGTEIKNIQEVNYDAKIPILLRSTIVRNKDMNRWAFIYFPSR